MQVWFSNRRAKWRRHQRINLIKTSNPSLSMATSPCLTTIARRQLISGTSSAEFPVSDFDSSLIPNPMIGGKDSAFHVVAASQNSNAVKQKSQTPEHSNRKSPPSNLSNFKKSVYKISQIIKENESEYLYTNIKNSDEHTAENKSKMSPEPETSTNNDEAQNLQPLELTRNCNTLFYKSSLKQ